MLRLKKIFSSTERQKPVQRSFSSKQSEQLETILRQQIPEKAVGYCVSLWQEQPFSFKVTKTRSTCLGNYRFQNGKHQITVNHDLNSYSFLVTYIHEVAHQHVQIFDVIGRKRVQPHGKEWKLRFQELMAPLLNEEFWPSDILLSLSKYMKNPKASSTSDPQLMKALRQYDKASRGQTLEDLNLGQTFVFKNRMFKKLEKRRTRALCQEIGSNRQFTIPLMAQVELVN
ncbi:SprT-like domain-containing protein [Jiulongibacter sp. NS-SX5]|uniref:SprT-like domain-containing protein n=1 Tax=Jiulongibacter sp. NS-SX5 TaxID=3463854 RepID=UPI004059A52E